MSFSVVKDLERLAGRECAEAFLCKVENTARLNRLWFGGLFKLLYLQMGAETREKSNQVNVPSSYGVTIRHNIIIEKV